MENENSGAQQYDEVINEAIMGAIEIMTQVEMLFPNGLPDEPDGQKGLIMIQRRNLINLAVGMVELSRRYDPALLDAALVRVKERAANLQEFLAKKMMEQEVITAQSEAALAHAAGQIC